jgi:hypothetical protein
MTLVILGALAYVGLLAVLWAPLRISSMASAAEARSERTHRQREA